MAGGGWRVAGGGARAPRRVRACGSIVQGSSCRCMHAAGRGWACCSSQVDQSHGVNRICAAVSHRSSATVMSSVISSNSFMCSTVSCATDFCGSASVRVCGYDAQGPPTRTRRCARTTNSALATVWGKITLRARACDFSSASSAVRAVLSSAQERHCTLARQAAAAEPQCMPRPNNLGAAEGPGAGAGAGAGRGPGAARTRQEFADRAQHSARGCHGRATHSRLRADIDAELGLERGVLSAERLHGLQAHPCAEEVWRAGNARGGEEGLRAAPDGSQPRGGVFGLSSAPADSLWPCEEERGLPAPLHHFAPSRWMPSILVATSDG